MQCAGLQDHSDPAPSRGPDHIRLAYQQFEVWELTWGYLLTEFLQHYFSLSLSTRMGTSWLNLSILLLTFTFYRKGEPVDSIFQYYFSLSLSLGRETSWLWPATPTMEIHCQPSNGTNRASTSPLRWGAEQKDKKVTKSCPPDVFCGLWHTQCGKADHHSEQERQWHGVQLWGELWLLLIAYCLLPIAYCLLTWCIVVRWVMATTHWGSIFFANCWSAYWNSQIFTMYWCQNRCRLEIFSRPPTSVHLCPVSQKI